MRMAAIQTVSTPDVDRNLEAAARLLQEAAAAGAQLVALPEYFCLMGRRDDDKLAHAEAPVADGERPPARCRIQRFLSDAAHRHGMWLVGGTVPVQAGADGADGVGAGRRVLNRCAVYDPHGVQHAHYDKIHLFSFDNGRERYDEGRTLHAGARPVAFTLDAADGPWRVGLSICYDLRFPELYRALSAQPGQPPCDLLCVPAAFTHTTGQAHWELLLRARAVENQAAVLAAAQGGTHENGRRTWGHSLIVDPWGEVLALREEGEGVVVADVARDRIEAVRRQLPALAHRRL
jgi:predicted amidohydrolase